VTEFLLDGKKLKSVEFHVSGEDGEFLWIRFQTEDGKTWDSYYLKGET
jgi:hypothetical protein